MSWRVLAEARDALALPWPGRAVGEARVEVEVAMEVRFYEGAGGVPSASQMRSAVSGSSLLGGLVSLASGLVGLCVVVLFSR
jgi:hypothetical protein